MKGCFALKPFFQKGPKVLNHLWLSDFGTNSLVIYGVYLGFRWLVNWPVDAVQINLFPFWYTFYAQGRKPLSMQHQFNVCNFVDF